MSYYSRNFAFFSCFIENIGVNLYNQKSNKTIIMSEQEKLELIKRKEMLFRFLRSMQKNKDRFADNDDDFNTQVDSILDQIIRINKRLKEFDDFY